MDHGRIEQIGTPEQVYMEPATPFVSHFVGETNRLPCGTHVRPHDIAIVTSDGEPVQVDNVFRKGGVWRVEGTMTAHNHVVEIDLDTTHVPPALGQTILISPRRSRTFPSNGAQP